MKPSLNEQTRERSGSPDRPRKGVLIGSIAKESSKVDEAAIGGSLQASVPRRRKKSKALRRLLVALMVMTVGAGFFYWVVRGSTRGPSFYQVALKQPPEEAYSQGEAFEQSLAQWHNELHANGGWQLVLDDEQLNGWLGAHLSEKFPGSLPADISDPRCSITENESRLAFQYHWKNWTFVVSTNVQFFLTEEQNVLGARLKGVRSGIVPLPITQWLGSAASSAAGAGVKIRWTQDQGSPLALITIPDTVPGDDDLALVLSGVEQRSGQLVLTGYTAAREPESASEAPDKELVPQRQD